MTFEKFNQKILNYYAITISPGYSKRSIKYDYYKDLNYLKRCLNLVSKLYILYPEITDQGRLHYHGVVHLDDKIKWFKQSKRRLETLGFIKFDPIKTHHDHIAWLIYCSKNWTITKEVIGLEQPMIYKKGTYYSDIKDLQKKNDLLDYGIKIF